MCHDQPCSQISYRTTKHRSSHHRLTPLVSLAILAMSSSLYGWGSAHWKITKAALAVLPANEISHWSPHRSGFRTYCLYPDMGLANKEAKKYLVVIRGRLFHYFPRDNKADYEFFNEGARIYFRKIIAEMRQGHYDEAARYAGALAHALEDLSQPQCHALEGVNGFAWTILDELFTPEDQTWNRAPQSVISLDGNTNFQVDLGDYKPRLLGTHPDEAAFRLYQRSCRVRRIARKALPPMLTATYAGDKDAAVQAGLRPAIEGARLVADMFHTCFAMAGAQITPEEEAELETLDLTSLVPITAPTLISIPYRFSPLAYGCSVTMDRKPVPMLLRLPGADGKAIDTVFKKGIGTGCCAFSYEIPAGVFKEFRCTAGLHAALGTHARGANLRMSIKFRGKEVFASGTLEAGSLAQDVIIPVTNGGRLEFVSQGNPGLAGNEANHAVWADPVFARLDPADRPAALSEALAEEQKSGALTAAQLGPNLLANASFEQWEEDGLPVGWRAHLRKDTACTIKSDTKEVKAGKQSARLTVDDSGSIVALFGMFPNEPGKRYRFTIHWKSPVGVLQYAIKKNEPKLGWIAFNGDNWQNKNANPLAVGSTDAWNITTVDFPAADKTMDMTVELCRPHGKGTGYSFFVDDIRVQEIKE